MKLPAGAFQVDKKDFKTKTILNMMGLHQVDHLDDYASGSCKALQFEK